MLEKLGLDPKTVITETTVSSAVLRGYAGEYRYRDETSVVTFEDGKLFMSLGKDNRERTVSLTIQLPELSYAAKRADRLSGARN